MRSPKHLWSGDWRSDAETARHDAAEAATRHREAVRRAELAAAASAATRVKEKRRSRLTVASVALGLAAVAAAFIVGFFLHQGSDTPPPLPAVADNPVPAKGNANGGASSGSSPGAVYAAASPAVVSVKTNEGSGTGFLISPDGKLVTNAHVVGSSSRVIVRFGPRGDSLDAQVMGTDVSDDLALLSIDSGAVPRGVKPLQFADSRSVRIGDPATAIGNPFGLDRTATEGIVSAVGRHIEAPNGFEIDSVIQTDAAINPGNSGGPLLDSSAHVIGVNSQIATGGGGNGNVGIGFAIPSNTVRQVIPRLEKRQAVPHAYLGLASTGSVNAAGGALVNGVIPGAPADKAGVQPGDLITEIGGRRVFDPSDISTEIGQHNPGDTVTMTVQRAGAIIHLQVQLGQRPQRTP
ncbi:MAG TPA: trypsin-like peptidase domain-containing protein [Thermoleophilaceae bacterium]